MNSTTELARQKYQRELDLDRSQLERNQLGQFSTPVELADEIARAVLPLLPARQPIRFLEPAIGSGAFFSALLQNKKNRIIGDALGFEIDPRFADVARQLWGADGLDVENEDFLSALPRAAMANLVIANPPYVRHHHVSPTRKKMLQERVRRELGISISGLSGLYCYFMLLTNEWLAEDAISAWLVPSEFMDVNYGKSIRTYLTDHVELKQIHRYCPLEDKFDDALVSSAVVIFRKRKPASNKQVRLTFGGPLEQPRVTTQISISELRSESRWTRLATARTKSQACFSAPRQTNETTLGDLFVVKRGVATGANGYFILPRAEATRLQIPGQFLKPILPSPRHLKIEKIERCDDGYPKIDRQLVLLDCNIDETQIKKKFPHLWDYLTVGKNQGIPAGYLTSHRDPWYSQEHRKPAPFLCSYMGRSETQPFRFFWNKSDAIVANVYLMLYPKREIESRLLASKQLERGLFDMLSQIKPEDFFDEGRVYGGGLFKLEPAELKRLPVRNLPNGLNLSKQQQLWE